MADEVVEAGVAGLGGEVPALRADGTGGGAGSNDVASACGGGIPLVVIADEVVGVIDASGFIDDIVDFGAGPDVMSGGIRGDINDAGRRGTGCKRSLATAFL